MDREVALEALGVLCNATVTSVQRQGVGLKAADISGAAAPELMTINDLVHRVLDGDGFRLLQGDISAEIQSLVKASVKPVCFLPIDTDKDSGPQVFRKPFKLSENTDEDSRGKIQLKVDEKEFFDPGYDFDFTNITDRQTFYRGGEKYERPCGWTRFALKVLGKYDDDTWLGNNWRTTDSVKGEWPVSYHGTSENGAERVTKGHYEPGKGQAYGRGIYSTPDISVAEGYAKIFQSKKTGKWYKVLLQNRINPEYREKHKHDKYWLVKIPEGTSKEEEKEMVKRAIRPYGLLLKEI